MKQTLGMLLLLLSGCDAPSATTDAALTNQPLLGGTLSSSADDAVVKVVAKQDAVTQTCTGALVAANLVVTARHCVADYVDLPFTCDANGELVSSGPGGHTGAPIAPENITIRTGAQPAADAADAVGIQVFAQHSSTVCRGDIALVLIDRPLLQMPLLRLRLDRGTSRNERIRAVGYGLFEDPDAGVNIRHSRDNLVVTHVGASQFESHPDEIPPRSFQIDGGGLCIGDSGGPAISDRGAVIGVFSKFTGACTAANTVNFYTETAPFAVDLILPAFTAAGAQPLPEYEPAAGAAGTSNAQAIISAEAGAGSWGGSGGVSPNADAPAQSAAAGVTNSATPSPPEELTYEGTPPKGGTCTCRLSGVSTKYRILLTFPLSLLWLRRRRGRQRHTGM